VNDVFKPLVQWPAAFFVASFKPTGCNPWAFSFDTGNCTAMMKPNVSTEVLRTLHRIHRQLTDLRERLERGPKQIAIRQAHVAHQEENLAQTQADAKAFRVASDSKQLQFKTKEDKLKELRTKLNQATSNREYQALKDQMAADEMANSVLADEIIEALDRIDAMNAAVNEARELLEKSKHEAERVRLEVAAREPDVRADMARLEAELKEAEGTLPDEMRDAYHRVVRHKGEDGLAPIVDKEFCGGCNQSVPINLYNALTLNRPIFCKSCGRLLYIPEEQA
jgi:predicted  nucleic acid-binding Zn-ribbon protein